MRTRSFLPPPACSRCCNRPSLGTTLINAGSSWLCVSCLTEDLSGTDVTTKQAARAIEADGYYSSSKRARAAGAIEDARLLNNKAQWHHQTSDAIREHGNRLARDAVIVQSEVLPSTPGFLKDTLSDPDLAAIESSETRGRLLKMNDVVALGIDVANTIKAGNTAEKLVAHEVAVAHKVSMEQAMRASQESDPSVELKRLQISARMMSVAQQGLLTLQKLKTGGTQSVVVQHVHVQAGGQAVVAQVQNRGDGSTP